MADKQISQLTENTTPATGDMFACQKGTTAMRITLDTIRTFIHNFTNATVTGLPNDGDYLHLNTATGGNKRITALNFKNYCIGSGWSSTYFATYNYTSFSDIQDAYTAGKVIYCTYNNSIWCPVVQFDGTNFKFYDAINDYIITVNSSDTWSRTPAGGGSSGGENFIAIYDTTTISEIESAVESGKMVWMRNSNSLANFNIFPLWRYYESGSTKEAEFYNPISSIRYKCSTSGWTT